jgi:glycosyltransferase involved in cell wall biosynthesis
VATRVGSVGETVQDGVSGYLVSPGDEQEMAARVGELLGDPTRARGMGRAGRDHVAANWSLERMVEGYQDLIYEIYEIYAGKCAAATATPDRRMAEEEGESAAPAEVV